jgi:hypothetical protein
MMASRLIWLERRSRWEDWGREAKAESAHPVAKASPVEELRERAKRPEEASRREESPDRAEETSWE